MRDVLKDIFGKDTDHERARQNAEEVALLLHSKVVSNHKIDFSRISLFHISPVQLGVVGSLVSAEFCAAQALVFRELMTVTIEGSV